MKAILRIGFLAVAIMVVLAVPANAGPFEDELAAYKREDYATALRFWRPLAELGHFRAEFNLGGMYRKGQGLPQDYAEAAKWYRKAAEQDGAEAQYSLGQLYRKGQGLPQDYAEAAKWYRKAAEQGHRDAQFRLGVMHGNGEGVPQDIVQAHMLFSLAAAQEYEKAKETRDKAASEMTPDQIAEAQRMAREWMAKHQR
jgi:TPR repeat protein